MRKSIDISIDVTDVVPLPGSQHIAATVHLPDLSKLLKPPIVIVASPGGGYNRHYFDLRFPTHGGYSEAEYHAQRGFVMVAYDHIGVGDSSIPKLGSITFEILAAANHAAVTNIAGKARTRYIDVRPSATAQLMQDRNRSIDGGLCHYFDAGSASKLRCHRVLRI